MAGLPLGNPLRGIDAIDMAAVTVAAENIVARHVGKADDTAAMFSHETLGGCAVAKGNGLVGTHAAAHPAALRSD